MIKEIIIVTLTITLILLIWDIWRLMRWETK